MQLAVGASFTLAIYDVRPGTSFQEVQEQSIMKTSTNAGEYSSYFLDKVKGEIRRDQCCNNLLLLLTTEKNNLFQAAVGQS